MNQIRFNNNSQNQNPNIQTDQNFHTMRGIFGQPSQIPMRDQRGSPTQLPYVNINTSVPPPPPGLQQMIPPMFPSHIPHYPVPPNTPTGGSPINHHPQINFNDIFYHPNYETQPHDAIHYYPTEIRLIRDPVTMTYREHLVTFYETPITIHMREWAKKNGLIPEATHPVPLILPDFVPSVQVPTAQQIPLPEFKNLSFSEPSGSPEDQKDEVVIEILEQTKETEDFGATVNMSAEDLLESQKNDGWDVREVSVHDSVQISDETGKSKSDSHVNKMKGRFYQSDKNWRDFKSNRPSQYVGPLRSQSQTFHKSSDRFTNSPDSAPDGSSTPKRGHYILRGVKNAEKSPIPETPQQYYSKPYKGNNYNNKKVTKDRIFKPSDKSRQNFNGKSEN